MNPCMKHAHYMRAHEWPGWLELKVDGEEYVIPCPHDSPSFFLFKPGSQEKDALCHNAGKDLCNNCYEPECSLAQDHNSGGSADGV